MFCDPCPSEKLISPETKMIQVFVLMHAFYMKIGPHAILRKFQRKTIQGFQPAFKEKSGPIHAIELQLELNKYQNSEKSLSDPISCKFQRY
jgi:hypothetical protein